MLARLALRSFSEAGAYSIVVVHSVCIRGVAVRFRLGPPKDSKTTALWAVFDYPKPLLYNSLRIEDTMGPQKITDGLRKYWLLWLTLAVAFVVRLPDRQGRSLYWYSELLRDLAVERSLAAGHWVFLGPSSHLGGFNFGPIYYYLLFPFTVAFHFQLFSPALASLFFSLATLVMSFFIIKSWHSEKLAYMVVILLAVCEFDITFAVYVSNPNLLPFFALAFFYAFEELLAKKNIYQNTVWLTIAFAVATQLHAVALISLPIILAIALLRKDLYFSAKQWVIFLCGNVALYAPYIYYELTHRLDDVTGLLHLARGAPAEGLVSRIVQYFGFWFGPWVIVHLDYDVFYIVGPILLYILAILLLIGYIIFYFNQRRLKPAGYLDVRVDQSVKKTLYYWLIVPTVILLIPIGPVTSLLVFYFFILTPLIYFFYGWAFYSLFKRGLNLVGWYLAAVFLSLQIFQFILYRIQLAQLVK